MQRCIQNKIEGRWDFQNNWVRSSVDPLSSKIKLYLVKNFKNSFKVARNCPKSTQQMKKHLFQKNLNFCKNNESMKYDN